MKSFIAPMVMSMASGASVGATMQTGGAINAPMSQIALPIPNRTQLDAYNVNREGWEGFTNCLYDAAAYPAAGLNVLSFFNTPLGSGATAKTLSDTNMTLAGQMPANQEFLIQSAEILFLPTTPTVAAAMPASLDAAANAAQVIINDSYIFYRSGNLGLVIGAKNYLQEAPLMKFPPKAYFHLDSALAGSSTVDTKFMKTGFATSMGRPYILKAPLRLVSNQNFNVTLAWPEGLQVISNPARIILSLDGVFYRRSQ